MKEPLVSIIIPNYNHARYLRDAVQSVLEQSYRNFEIIVVDDGSTDDSRAIAAEFGEQIRYIWQENQGLSAARNTGIATASGEYIGLLDADDIYKPHFLDTLLSALRKDSQADGIICGYQFVDEHNRLLPQSECRVIPAQELHNVLLRDGNFLVPESILVHRRCYETAGPFDVDLSACEDWDMWLRITANHRIISCNEILTRHRVLAGSMSSDPTRMVDNRLRVLAKHLGPEPEHVGGRETSTHRVYGQAYLLSTVEYLQTHNLQRAYESLSRAAELCPQLFLEMQTFYELGCGHQPKGNHGNLAELDVANSTKTTLELIERLFHDPQSEHRLRDKERKVYAKAYFALGLLAYGAQKIQFARRFLLQALIHDPSIIGNGQFAGIIARVLLGPTLINRLKQLRNNTTQNRASKRTVST